MGTPARMAILKGPRLKGCNTPLSEREPSGKATMEFPACSDLTESLKVSSWLRLDVWLSGMCSASCIGQPINGISRMDAFDTYFSGRGTKPVSVRMSRKEAWLGAYTHAPSGRFSTPTTSG